jgi:hypothetical protein
MISASSIIAAMSDPRPGRYYSVDELAAVLRIQDKTELREQLRSMASDPNLDSSVRLLKSPSEEFYRRVSFAATLTRFAPWETKIS